MFLESNPLDLAANLSTQHHKLLGRRLEQLWSKSQVWRTAVGRLFSHRRMLCPMDCYSGAL
jgi:hypothetical protein